MSRIHDALRIAEQTGVENIPEIPDPDLALGRYGFARRDPRSAENVVFDAEAAAQNASRFQRVEDWNLDHRLLLDFSRGSSGAEQFRTLRSRLHQIRTRRPLRTILITSAMAGEGKSFVAANLAHAMAYQQMNRVLLIDGDLRKPRLHEILGAPAEPGLVEYLSGNVDEFQAVQQGAIKNLFFVSAGQISSNSAELLTSDALPSLMKQLSKSFDWIIIDSPPVLPVSDSSLLSNSCDGILMVVASGQTPIDAVTRATQDFAREEILGVVLNRMEPASHYDMRYSSYSAQNKVN